MSVTYNAEPLEWSLKVLECLREAVTEELERKRRLGHYAVFWEDGKILFVGDDAPPNPE